MNILSLVSLLVLVAMVTADNQGNAETQRRIKEKLQAELVKRIALKNKHLDQEAKQPTNVKEEIKEQHVQVKNTTISKMMAAKKKKSEHIGVLSSSLGNIDNCVMKLENLVETLESIVAEHEALETRVLTLEQEKAELLQTLNERREIQNRDECATKDDFRRFLRSFETTTKGRAMKRWFGEDIYNALEGIVTFVPDIIEFFNNFYNTVRDFVENVYNEVSTCFGDLEACLKRILENIVTPVLEALKENFLFMLQTGPGIGGPVEVWQGMAHQLRLGDSGKCLGYQDNGGSYSFVAENCFDPSSDLKNRFTQDFKLTPSDNCHDTTFSVLDVVDFLIRVCNFGDQSTGRNWFMMAEMSVVGHVFARGRVEQTGSNSGTFSGEKVAPFPFGLFTRTVKITASVVVSSSEIQFSITDISTNPTVGFIDALYSPLETSFTLPLPSGTNTGGFQALQDVVTDAVVSSSAMLCSNGCQYRGDGDCDDGGPNSDYSVCSLGDDCDDCGARFCTETCRYSGDGDCDDGGPNSQYSVCDYGTDCTDCGVRT